MALSKLARSWILGLALLAAAGSGSALAAQFGNGTPARKLSGEYALAPSGDVVAAKLTPDRQRVVFLARAREGARLQLFAAPADGSALPTALGPVGIPERLVTGGSPLDLFQISADGAEVVHARYSAAPTSLLETPSVSLFRVPLDGSAAPLALQPAPVLHGNVVAFTLAAGVVVYRADQHTAGVFELFAVPLDGSAPPARLNPPLGSDRDVGNFVVAGDGSRVAFVADLNANQRNELFSVPSDGSTAPLQLSASQNPTSSVALRLTPDGTRVVYTENAVEQNRRELFGVPLDGSAAPVKLDTPLPVGATTVHSFQLTPDSSRVVFDVRSATGRTLLVAPVDGSSAALVLSDDQADVFVCSATHAVYRSFAGDLWGVPLSGSAALALTQLLEVRQFQLEPDGARVVFTAIPSGPSGPVRLYGVPVDGATGAIELQGTLPASGNVREPPTLGDGGTVLYLADAEVDERFDLFTVPSIGGVAPVRLALGGAGMDTHVLTADDAALFQGDAAWPGVRELFRVPLDASAAPAELAHLPRNTQLGDFTELALSADERWLVYRGDPNEIGRFELFGARADGSGRERRLSAPLPPGGDVLADFAIDPASRYVVYRADQELDERFELYRVALDGSQAPQRLSVTLPPGADVDSFALSPEGTFVAYRADAGPDGAQRLYSTRHDGAFPIVLTPDLVAGGNVERDYRWASEFSVVYRADQDVDGSFELYLADGMGHTPKLSAPLVPGGDVSAFALGGGGVVYCADQDVDEQFELYARSGAAAAVQISAEPSLAGTDVQADFVVSPDGQWALYRADTVVDERFELHRAPLGGGASPLRINTANGVSDFALTRDGARVLYRSSASLKTRPLDASLPEVALGGAGSYVLAPTSEHVAFSGGGFGQVSIARVDGVGGATLVPSFDPFAGHGSRFAFTPDGKHVLLHAFSFDGLLLAPVAAPGEAVRLGSRTLAADPVFVPGRRQVLFLGDHQTGGVFEVFARPYSKPGVAAR